jgi:hypothetical protein
MWVGPEVCKLAVVTESMPWWSEPFDGPSGEMFKGAMTTVGIGIEKVAFGAADDDPKDREAQFVLLCGDVALSRYRTNLRVAHCHGRPMMLDHRILFPVFHPEAYWRNPRWRSLLDHELKQLMLLAKDKDQWRSFIPQSCVKCRGAADYTDLMGVVYCTEHAPK